MADNRGTAAELERALAGKALDPAFVAALDPSATALVKGPWHPSVAPKGRPVMQVPCGDAEARRQLAGLLASGECSAVIVGECAPRRSQGPIPEEDWELEERRRSHLLLWDELAGRRCLLNEDAPGHDGDARLLLLVSYRRFGDRLARLDALLDHGCLPHGRLKDAHVETSSPSKGPSEGMIVPFRSWDGVAWAAGPLEGVRALATEESVRSSLVADLRLWSRGEQDLALDPWPLAEAMTLGEVTRPAPVAYPSCVCDEEGRPLVPERFPMAWPFVRENKGPEADVVDEWLELWKRLVQARGLSMAEIGARSVLEDDLWFRRLKAQLPILRASMDAWRAGVAIEDIAPSL